MEPTELLQAILDSPTQHALIVTDPYGNVKLWNRGAARIFQYREEEIVGRNARVLFPPDDLARDIPAKEMATARRKGCAGDFRWHVRKDGSLFWADGMLYPVAGRDGAHLGFVKVLRDATEQKMADDEHSRLALEDSLTGLPNRTEFHHRFVDMRASAQRHERSLILLLLDLDHFKEVNDTRGHAVGDAVLQQAAHRLRTVLRDTDFAARLGGDEFVVLLPDADSPDAGGAMAERLIGALSRPFQVDHAEVLIGASVGVSMYPQDAQELDALFIKADLALYRAKAEGRSAYRFYTPEMDASVHRRALEHVQLRRAIKERAFSLRFQPRVDTAHGAPVAVEALLRCEDPFFADYPTAEILALATETGRMRRLGLWVFSRAVKQVRRWQQEGRPELALDLNFGRVEFTDPRFAHRIVDFLARTHLPAGQLHIDIPEAHLAGDFDPRQLIALDEAGVAMGIDDLGSGGLSLKHLLELPIASVKLDLRFLPGLPGDPRSRAIVIALTQLAHLLGIQVVAEGVESPEQADFLRPFCDGLQGMYVAAPMTAGEMGEWLKGHAPSGTTARAA